MTPDREPGAPVASHGVSVVIGLGGMGRAIARRIGPGTTLAVGDVDPAALEAEAAALTAEGYDVLPVRVDVGDIASVTAFAGAVATRGPVMRLAHTAGLSPVQSSAERINRVDLVGVAAVLDAFGLNRPGYVGGS